jgi:hypothetical protein
MQTEFRFRLNGDIMPELFAQRALVNGEPVGELEIAVEIDYLGRFTLDDNTSNSSSGYQREYSARLP